MAGPSRSALAISLKRALGRVEVSDVERAVRAERVGLLPAILARDDMQRIVADSVPRAAEAEIRTRNPLQADHIFIKGRRLLDIADPKRRMIECFQLDHGEFSRYLSFLMQFAAARDVDRLAGNVFRAAQIDHRLADIVWRLLALEERIARDNFVERRLAINPVLNADDRIEHIGKHRSAQKPGAYGVDANV